MPNDPVLPDGLVREHYQVVEAAGFLREDVEQLLDSILRFGYGTDTEEISVGLIERLPVDRLGALVERVIMPPFPSGIEWQLDLTAAPHVVIEQLVARGIGVRESSDEGWALQLSDGTRILKDFRDGDVWTTESATLESRGEALCRAALIAFYRATLRSRRTEVA